MQLFADLDLQPSAATLRRFAWISLGAYGLIGAWFAWQVTPGSWWVPGILWGVGGTIFLLRWIYLPALRPIQITLQALSLPIAWAVNAVLLAVMYYGVFTPVACLFRLMRRDRLGLRPDPARSSYWIDRSGPRPLRRYFRQY